MATFTLDFVGMCLVMKQADQVSVGLVDDPGHMHLVAFADRDGLSVVESLSFRDKVLPLTGVVPGGTQLRHNDRLPDLQAIPDIDIVPSMDEIVRDHLRSHIILTGGVLEAHRPIEPIAEGPWRFAGESGELTHKLTDRLRFVATINAEFVKLGDLEIFTGNRDVRATIIAVDHDPGRRRMHLRRNEPLTEFGVFYRCTRAAGPIPTYQGAPPANPGNPICPDLMVTFD